MFNALIGKFMAAYVLFMVVANVGWLTTAITSYGAPLYETFKSTSIYLDSFFLAFMAASVVFWFVVGLFGGSGVALRKWQQGMIEKHGLFFFAGLAVGVALLYWWSVIAAVAAVGLYIAMLFAVPSKAKAGGASNKESAAKSVTDIAKSGITLSDVIGMEETKTRLLRAGRAIVDSYKAKPRKKVRNGILMYGPGGTGKTTLAKALAGELGLPIMHFNFSQANSMWIGEGSSRVIDVFKEAISNAPIVLFLDEVESIFVDRSKIHQAENEAARLTSALLPLIEEAREKGVVLIAATNVLEKIDPAAIREGRFDYKIEVGYPDFPARKAILEKAFKDNKITVDVSVIEKAASRWEGYSIPRLQGVAAELADGQIMTAGFSDLTQAMRRIQGRKGSKKKTHRLDDLILAPEMKTELESLVWRLKHADELEELGGSLPSGLLFYGDPGTGKGHTAVAIANSADWAFLSVSGQDLTSSDSKIDEIMKEASEIRPVLVFIDEAEDVLGHRQGGFSNMVTNKILAVMDGTQGKAPDIVFIAATNHPDQIDAAALRGGRFTEKLMFQPPKAEQVVEFAQKWLSNKPKLTLGSDVTMQWIGEFLAGYSLANVNAVLQTAANTVIANRKVYIDKDDILSAARKII